MILKFLIIIIVIFLKMVMACTVYIVHESDEEGEEIFFEAKS